MNASEDFTASLPAGTATPYFNYSDKYHCTRLLQKVL